MKKQVRDQAMAVIVPKHDMFTDDGKHPAGEPWEVTWAHAQWCVDEGLAVTEAAATAAVVKAEAKAAAKEQAQAEPVHPAHKGKEK